MKPTPVLLVGTGALATLFAARLAGSGLHVLMLGNWPEGLTTLNEKGARLLLPDGREQAFVVRASDSPSAFKGVELAFVLVKAWQTGQAARALAACLAKDGLAVTLQNGLGNRETLVGLLGEERVLQGITTSGATLMGPGLVRPGGDGITTLAAHPRAAEVQSVLQMAGFETKLAADVESLLWGKLVINAGINPLTAILNIPNGELLQRPGARQLMAQLAGEAAAVAAARGIRLPFADPVTAAEQVAERTGANISSMLQDVRRNAPTEIDAICGAVTRHGEASGIPTPINRAMWQLIVSLRGKLSTDE